MTGLFGRLPQISRHISLQAQNLLRFATGKLAYLQLATPSLNLRRVKRRDIGLLGWPGMAGICLLSICPAFYFSAILPAQEKLASTRDSVIALQEQMKHAGRAGPGASQRTPEEQLDEFYRMFPEGRKMPEYLEKIFSSAQEQGISLDQGEYKITRNKEGNLVSFQMAFPVKGDYPQIRKYLAALLADIPVLSLQQVQFKRQKVGDSEVEANIRLGLYFLEQRS